MTKTTTFVVAVCLIVVLMSGGCASLKKGPTPEEAIMQRAQAAVADFLAGNTDKFLDYISEGFSGAELPAKADLGKRIEEAKNSGLAAAIQQFGTAHNGQIDLTTARVTMTGKNSATVAPVAASIDLGSVTVELVWQKDKDKVWRIRAINVPDLPAAEDILGFFGKG